MLTRSLTAALDTSGTPSGNDSAASFLLTIMVSIYGHQDRVVAGYSSEQAWAGPNRRLEPTSRYLEGGTHFADCFSKTSQRRLGILCSRRADLYQTLHLL
jgi:hypothetical protein